MTINRDYMLRVPAPPSASKQFFDQRVVPVAVNAVGALEVGLYRVSDRTGIRPAVIVTGLMVGASLLLMSQWRGLRRLR